VSRPRTELLVSSYFRKIYGYDAVLNCTVVVNCDQLLTLVSKELKLLARVDYFQELLKHHPPNAKNGYRFSQFGGSDEEKYTPQGAPHRMHPHWRVQWAEKELDNAEYLLAAVQEKIVAERKTDPKACGKLFVTFADPGWKEQCIEDFATPGRPRLLQARTTAGPLPVCVCV